MITFKALNGLIPGYPRTASNLLSDENALLCGIRTRDRAFSAAVWMLQNTFQHKVGMASSPVFNAWLLSAWVILTCDLLQGVVFKGTLMLLFSLHFTVQYILLCCYFKCSGWCMSTRRMDINNRNNNKASFLGTPGSFCPSPATWDSLTKDVEWWTHEPSHQSYKPKLNVTKYNG